MSEKIADVIKETENNKADRQEQYFFRTDQLTVGYDGKPLIREINIQLKKGEILTLIGPNGAGKSTLLKIIVGELPADEGTVTLAKGKTLGYLAQHQDMDDARTIYETVLEGKRQLIDMEQKIRELEEGMQSISKEEMESYMESYHKLLHEFEARDGYHTAVRFPVC